MERQKNYLVHYGIKGMKWKNHTYKSIVGGEYIYDTAQITNTAAQMKKQGYTHDEIKATIRSNMANTRAANASPGGNYSGSMNRAKQTVASQNKPQTTASTNNKYQSELNKAKSNAAAEAASKEKELEQKDWIGLKVNNGEDDSLEMLADGNVDDLGFSKEKKIHKK